MKKPSHISHPLLSRSGTSQRTRVIDALDTNSAIIDGKTLADKLHLISSYAKQINFYEYVKTEEAEFQNIEDWSAFFQNSLPFQLANFSKTSIKEIESDFEFLYNEITSNPSIEAFESLLVFTLNKFFDPIENLFNNTKTTNNGLNGIVLSIIKTSFTSPLKKYIKVYNAAVTFLGVARKNYMGYMSAPWYLGMSEIFEYDEAIKGVTKGSEEAILIAAQKVNELFNQLLSGLQSIIITAPNYINEALLPLEASLQKRHQPHLALLFTFLKLLDHLQLDINSLGKKHLDFFYQQVLKIAPKEAEPDAVHVVFEIAKHLKDYVLKEELLLKDGKDSNNQDIQFALDNEIVIDKAKIKELRTLALNKNNEGNIEGVYIAPMANSSDGLGKEFDKNQSLNWSTLGSKESKLLEPIEISENDISNECDLDQEVAVAHPSARLGFIIASPVLLLQEGKRIIKVKLKCASTEIECDGISTSFPVETIACYLNKLNLLELFTYELTGEKEWLKASPSIVTVIKEGSQLIFDIEIELNSDFDAVVFYNEAVLGEKLDIQSTYPALKITLNPEQKIEANDGACNSGHQDFFDENNCVLSKINTSSINEIDPYQYLRALQIENATINVEVCGVKNLIVQNDNNLQDVNKPILPFGPRPKVGEDWFIDGGANFYIGSKEIFCKNWKNFRINTTWKDKPLDLHDYYRFYRTQEFEDGSLAITDTSFRFQTSILRKGKWFKDLTHANKGKIPTLEASGSGTSVFDKDYEQDYSDESELYSLFHSSLDKVIADNSNTYHHRFVEANFSVADTEEEESKEDNYIHKSMPTEVLEPLTVNSRKGFIKLTLAGVSFQHDLYTYVLTRQMMALADLIDPESIQIVQQDLNNSKLLQVAATARVNVICNKIKVIGNEANTTVSQINSFSSQINTIVNDMNTVLTDLNTQISNIDNQSGEFDNFSTEIGSIINETDSVIADITSIVSSDIAEIISELNDEIIPIPNNVLGTVTTISNDYQDPDTPNLLNDVINQLNDLVGRLGANVNDTNNSLFGKIGELEGNANTLNENVVNNIKNLLDSLKSKIDTSKIENDSINTEMAKIEDSIEGFISSLENLESEIASLSNDSKLEQCIKEIEKEIIESFYINDEELIKRENISNDDIDADNELKGFGAKILLKELGSRLDRIISILKVDQKLGLPQEPYTPLISELSIDYHASADEADMDIVHLYPFENTSKHENIEEQPSLFPVIKDEGTLFVGIESLTPGGTLSLLFQLAEATANSEMDKAQIEWSYLADNQWKTLAPDFNIISDATDGLTVSGIVNINLPKDINRANTIMPDHLYWIKVATCKNAKAVAEVIGIHTQAGKATAKFSTLNDRNRLDNSLAAGSVSKLSEGDFSVKKVVQPYPSFGGRQPEAQGHFYVRVSEHLKHKGRALMLSDYEKIVLEGFPNIYKAKCISHTMGLSAINYQKDLEVAPGYVVITVVPDLTKLISGSQTEPKVPVSLLGKIRDHLRERIPAFARIKVMNPRYEPVEVVINVRLQKGKSSDFYRKQLKEDITNFLAPWFLGDTEKIAFGMSVLFSDIVGFVEKLDYINVITNLSLADQNGVAGLEIKPLTARSILTAGKICVKIDEEKCPDTTEVVGQFIGSL